MNWTQLRAILWVRYRLTRNQFVRAGQVNAVLSIFIMAALALAAIGLGVAGLALGPLAGRKAPPEVLMYIWDGLICGFCFVWLMGLVVELQRSESIDLDRLLHLPISLQQVFAFNFVASLFTPSILLLVPAMLLFGIGLALGAGIRMIFVVPLIVSFLFMVTAWTYCLRGWLAALMVNKRRRRTIVVWLTVFVVMLGQLPNILLHTPFFKQQSGKKAGYQKLTPELVADLHQVVPLGWPGYGAMKLREGELWPSLAATAACLLIGGVGFRRAYRLTMRFYTGSEGKIKIPAAGTSTAASPAVSTRTGTLMVERRLAWLPNDVAGLALATFRSLLRAPELKAALVLPIVFGAIGISTFLSATKTQIPWPARELAASLAVFCTLFFLAPSMSNSFGLDRNGFRSLVLLPTPRHYILCGKNLGFFPFILAMGTVLVSVVAALMHAPVSSVITAFLQIPTSFLIFCLPCNLSSILAPYRLAQGTLKAKRPKAMVVLAMMLSMFIQPLVVGPTLIPVGLQILFRYKGWVPWLPINILGTLCVFALAAGLYWMLLSPLGNLLQRREQTILKEVTEEVE